MITNLLAILTSAAEEGTRGEITAHPRSPPTGQLASPRWPGANPSSLPMAYTDQKPPVTDHQAARHRPPKGLIPFLLTLRWRGGR
jgi:hypothetical protein